MEILVMMPVFKTLVLFVLYKKKKNTNTNTISKPTLAFDAVSLFAHLSPGEPLTF
jgi:hypothetical protein